MITTQIVPVAFLCFAAHHLVHDGNCALYLVSFISVSVSALSPFLVCLFLHLAGPFDDYNDYQQEEDEIAGRRILAKREKKRSGRRNHAER
jgi:hypothetical protein